MDARTRFARLGLSLGLGAVVLLPAVGAVIALAFFQSRSDGALLWYGLRTSPFLNELLPSFAYSAVLALVGTLLALCLNPALLGGQRSSRLRIGALAVGVFLPPVLLVLIGANLVKSVGLFNPIALFVAHMIAVYPAVALMLAVWFEAFFVQIFDLAKINKAGLFMRLGLTARLRSIPLASVVLIASTVVFQDYLINLTLRKDPSSNALVALMALFPQTGVQWNVAMAAVLIILTFYGAMTMLAVKALRI